mgnify:CR=1 FL=1
MRAATEAAARTHLEREDVRARVQVEVLSALDAMVGPLRTQKEKTYSAPLATHLFAKETLQGADGREIREFPRLRYGGAGLKDVRRDHVPDVLQRAALGLGAGLLLWMLPVAWVCRRVARRSKSGLRAAFLSIARRETQVPWHAILLAIGAAPILLHRQRT